MNSLLISFLEAINAEEDVLLEINELNLKLRSALVGHNGEDVSHLSKELALASERVSKVDKTRESLWLEIQSAFSLEGPNFYSKLQGLDEGYKEAQTKISKAYRNLNLAYEKLRNSTASLEIYTDTALDIAETLMEGTGIQQSSTAYCSSGTKQMKEYGKSCALLINEEI